MEQARARCQRSAAEEARKYQAKRLPIFLEAEPASHLPLQWSG